MNLKTLLCYILGPIGSGVLGLILVPFLAWYFNTEQIGKYSMFQVYIGLFVLTSTIGLDHSYVRFFYEENNKVQLFWNSLFFSFFISLCIIGTIFIFDYKFFSETILSVSDTGISFLIFISFIIAFLLRFIPLVLRMYDCAFKYSLIELIQKCSLFVTICIMLFLFGFDAKVDTIIYSYILSGLIALVFCAFFVRGFLVTNIKTKISFEYIKPHLKYGLPLALTGFVSWLLIYADRFVLQLSGDYEELGIYAVSLSLSGIVSVFTSVFSLIWGPSVYKWVSKNIARELLPLLSKAVCYVSIMLISFIGIFSC